MKKTFFFGLLCVCLSALTVFGQTGQVRRTGAVFDSEAYNRLPKKPVLLTRSYEGLPQAVSLKQYAPLPGDQTDYGTCVAWAVAYAARTISESVALNRQNQTETTQNVFSPVYIYRNIVPDDATCQQGVSIHTALDLMIDSGAVKMLDVERTTDFPMVDISYYRNSRRYPITGYVTLFSDEDTHKEALVTRMVKKSLSEGKPVIIGMNTPDSFLEARNVWEPAESSGLFYGGHAMCVVGYDDSRYGGAFEVLNSWGRKWGNAGFMWIPYKVFTEFVVEGYEMIENLSVYSDTVRFAGSTSVEISGSAQRRAAVTYSPQGYYMVNETLTRGDTFQYVIEADESAYVYSFAVTQTPEGNFSPPIQMFPQAGVSALLNYNDSSVAIPGEDKALLLDDEQGIEFIVTLYAKQALDLRTIMERFESAAGTLNARLAEAVGTDLLSTVSFNETEAAFTAEPDNQKAVAALIVAIEHR